LEGQISAAFPLQRRELKGSFVWQAGRKIKRLSGAALTFAGCFQRCGCFFLIRLRICVRTIGTSMQSTFDERSWLAWLVKVRILILTFLLGIQLAVARLTPTSLPLRLFVSTILLWYTVSLFYAMLLSFWREHRLQASLQVLTDLFLVSLVVHETGGWDSSLNFLYPLVIIVAGILLPQVWAYLVAALAFILYGAVLELNYYGVVRSYCITHPGLKALQAIIFVNLFAFLAVSYLAGLLAAKLRQARVQLKDASGALENLQILHENIIQSISSGLITTGLDGRITLVNSAAQKFLECAPEELLGTAVNQLFLDALPNAESEDAHAEVRFDAAGKFRKTFRVRVAALNVPKRGALGYVYVLDDLTGIRRLEREVRMQDRLAAVGRLAAAIAHEIRNPLTSIAGSVSMLSGIPDLNAEHRQLLDIVTRESQRLNAIITDFLAYSRGKQYRFDRADLVRLLEDTLTLVRHRMTAENTGITVESHYSVPEAWVLADGDRLKQVFWNFSENAVRAMRKGGTLRVDIEISGDDWQISFADTGMGMTPKQTEKVFEPFQSTFEGGTGLGLAIVYQIVQAHEGKVWARSRTGQGTTFILKLRRLDAERKAAPQTTDVNASSLPVMHSTGPATTAAAEGGRRG
jgi:two-component system sensor histidine kinase PilS (NtrC family)